MSRIEKQLEALINDTEYSETPLSRVEAILQSMIDNTEYNEIAQSRIEELLLQLKENSGGKGLTFGLVYSNNIYIGEIEVDE